MTTHKANHPLLGDLASTLALGRAVEERMRKECACELAVPQVWIDLNAAALAIDAGADRAAHGEHEQRSCEGSERRPEVVEILRDLRRSAKLGDYDPQQIAFLESIADRLASALPRGLPAGSDAAVRGWPAIDRGTPESNAELREKLGDMLGIGIAARTNSTILSNIANVMRFADLLDAVEREFFMVPGKVDDDVPDEEPEPECALNRWGSTPAEYIEQFRAALAAQQRQGKR